MRIFKNPWFTRFASKEGIQDSELKDIVHNVLKTGQADADLGGGVYKVRIARSGEGKAGGYRVIVFFKSKERTFFVYGFSKSDKDNIDKGELHGFKVDAKYQLTLTDEQLDAWLKKKSLIEIL